jgi:acetyl esterase/lipase
LISVEPSAEAKNVLSKANYPLRHRRINELGALRDETVRAITPAVDRIIKLYKPKVGMRDISDIPCMWITPHQQKVNWKILYGYGGGYVSGSPFEDLTIAVPLADETGAEVVIPHYRLAPESPWPAAIDDGLSVFKEMSSEPLALVGESAGGNLCLTLILRAVQLGIPLPRAAAFLSPWCDLSNAGASVVDNDGRDPALSAQHINFAASYYVGENDPTNPMISPIYGVFDKSFPPSIITTGSRDLLMSQAIGLRDVLKDNNVPVELCLWKDLWHVFEWDYRLPESSESIRQISDWLQRYMPNF